MSDIKIIAGLDLDKTSKQIEADINKLKPLGVTLKAILDITDAAIKKHVDDIQKVVNLQKAIKIKTELDTKSVDLSKLENEAKESSKKLKEIYTKISQEISSKIADTFGFVDKKDLKTLNQLSTEWVKLSDVIGKTNLENDIFEKVYDSIKKFDSMINEAQDDYIELLKVVNNSKIKVEPFGENYENEIRKKFGVGVLSSKSGLPMDSFYGELRENFGHILPDVDNIEDMVHELLDALEYGRSALKNKKITDEEIESHFAGPDGIRNTISRILGQVNAANQEISNTDVKLPKTDSLRKQVENLIELDNKLSELQKTATSSGGELSFDDNYKDIAKNVEYIFNNIGKLKDDLNIPPEARAEIDALINSFEGLKKSTSDIGAIDSTSSKNTKNIQNEQLKESASLYSALTSSMKEANALQIKMLTAGEQEQVVLQNTINLEQARQNKIREQLSANEERLVNTSKENQLYELQVDLYNKLAQANAKLNDTEASKNAKNIQNEALKESASLYSALTSSMKEANALQIKMLTAGEQEQRVLQDKIDLEHTRQSEIQSRLSANGNVLKREEKENQIYELRIDLLNRLQQVSASIDDAGSSRRLQNARQINAELERQGQLLTGLHISPTANLGDVQSALSAHAGQNIVVRQLNDEYSRLGMTFRTFTAESANADGSLNRMRGTINQSTGEVRWLSNQIQQAGSNVEKFGNNVAGSVAQLFSWHQAIALLERLVKNAINYVIDLDNALNEIRVTTNKSAHEVENLGKHYNQMARDMSVSTKDVASAAVEFYRQGLGDNKVAENLQAAITYSKIAKTELAQSAKLITASMNAMGVSAERAMDVFSYLGDATATGADEIGKAMQKVGNGFSVLDIDFEKGASWIATISSKTRESAETVGTSVNAMLAKLRQLKEKGFVNLDNGDTVNVSEVSKALERAGIDLINPVTKEFNDFGETIDLLGEKWHSLDSNVQAYISTTLAGTYQQSRFYALMAGYAQSVKLYEGAIASQGIAQKKYDIYMESSAATLDAFKAKLEDIYIDLIDSDFLKDVVNSSTKLLDVVSALAGFLTSPIGAGTLGMVLTGVNLA